MEASLSAEAQQVLERMLFLPSYDWGRSIGLGGPQGYVNDYAVSYYSTLSPSGRQCTISQAALANDLGTNQTYLLGWGWLGVVPKASVDYDAVAAGLWGSRAGMYDFRLVIRPVMTASCSVSKGSPTWASLRLSGGFDGVVAYTVYGMVLVKGSGNSGDRFLLCEAGGRASTSGGRLDVAIGTLTCEDGSTVQAGQADELLVIFEKLDVPYAYCVNGTHSSNRPLVYGFTYYKGGYRLYLAHDATVECGSGNVPALGIRYIELVWGGQRIHVADNVVLDPGVGQGPVKVDVCTSQSCDKTARCAACYVAIPPGPKVAIVAVESSATPGGATLLAIPLTPYMPVDKVDLRSWVRWGFPYGQIPSTYSAVASRLVNGLGYTYNVTFLLYRWPHSLK